MNSKMVEDFAYGAEVWSKEGDFQVDLEVFAKLIIQECIKEVSQYSSVTIHTEVVPANPTREDYEERSYIKGIDIGYNDAVRHIANGLRTHFGVDNEN